MHGEHTTAVAPRPALEVRRIPQLLKRADSPRHRPRGRLHASGLVISLLLHGAALAAAALAAGSDDPSPIPEASVVCTALCETPFDLDDEADLLEAAPDPTDLAMDFEFEEPCEEWEPPEILESAPDFELPEDPELRPHAQTPVDPAVLLSAPRREPKPKPTSLAFRPPTAVAQSESPPTMTQTRRARAKQPRPRARPSGASPRKGLRVTYAPDPRRYYPAEAVRRGIEGTARVGFVVDARGTVTRAWIETSSGSDQLDRAALALIHAYRFEPLGEARRTLKPVSFYLAASARQYSSRGRFR